MPRERRIGRVLWVGAAIIIALATLTPGGQPASSPDCPSCDDLAGVDIVLNVLLFLPLGAGLAMDRVKLSKAVLIMCAASGLIELLQLGVVPGRDASLIDVATNSAGGVIGFLVGSCIDRLVFPPPVMAAWLASGWLCLWLGVQLVSGYALRADPPNAQYFGQLVRPLGDEPQYPGRMLRATIAGYSFPDWELRDWRAVSSALASDSGATTSLEFESRGQVRDFAALARIIGNRQEALEVGATGSNMTFSVRSRANDLHLRPLHFMLRGALPGTAASHPATPDTAIATVRYARSVAKMSVASRGVTRSIDVPLRTTSGWRLFSPADVYLDGSIRDALLDGAWLFAMLAVAGYWISFVVAGVRAKARLVMAVYAGPVLAVAYGLLLVPRALGLASLAWWEISAAFAALIGGNAMGVMVRDRRARA